MTAYLDTSALHEICVDEEGSDATWQVVAEHALATCRITWVEDVATIARREREGAGAATTWHAARQRLAADPRCRSSPPTGPPSTSST